VSWRTPPDANASPWNVMLFIFVWKVEKLKEIDFAWGSNIKKMMKS
jgi:hypothetical protein